MGRPSLTRFRIKDPEKRTRWAAVLTPYFLSEGIRSVPIDRVAAILHRSKATVYQHFESHQEIVSLIVRKKLTELKDFQQIIEDASRSHEERYVLAMAHVSEHLKDISTIFLSDLKEVYPGLWELISSFKEMALAILRTFYRSGIGQGVFQNIGPDLMVLSDELFFDVLTNPDYLADKGLDLQDVFDGYFRMRFHGILKTS